MSPSKRLVLFGHALIFLAIVGTATVYAPGLSGAFLFDDYPNIVDNKGVQPADASLPSLVRVALSSPASEFKRPLASLSFGLNYLATGLNPYWMKLTNLGVHLANGLLIFLLMRMLLIRAGRLAQLDDTTDLDADERERIEAANCTAGLISMAWLLLPINLTCVLYVVQRMESLANLFILIGLIGYIHGRQLMFDGRSRAGFLTCVASVTLPAGIGLLAKETAVLLPLYAFLVESALFRFHGSLGATSPKFEKDRPAGRLDKPVAALFLFALVLPMAIGLCWLLPNIMRPESWGSRNFTLGTRLLSELRIVVDYVDWTLLPSPKDLSFYHDDFVISTSLLKPWSTIVSGLAIIGLFAIAMLARKRYPLAFLGILFFMAGQSLTATILPLELVYEHRNYFASAGLLLALVPLLACIPGAGATPVFAWPRRAVLASLMFWWIGSTAMTAQAWGNPLRLAEELASRTPNSPRAQYELGRTYIIYSQYDPNSPFTEMAYTTLERAAQLPDSSILPEQALIFMNARMGLAIKDSWWESLISRLAKRNPGVQDESSMSALAQCAREHRCELSKDRMNQAFQAALSHKTSSARLLAIYSDYAWNVLNDRELGESLIRRAISIEGSETAYRITLIRMLLAEGRHVEAKSAIQQLTQFNIGGQLNDTLAELTTLSSAQ